MNSFWQIKRGHKLPLIKKAAHKKQTGAAMIAAIFVITGLAALGGLMTQFLVLGTEETINEWYSAQALYAAESGAEWAAFQIETGAYSTACPYSSGTQDVVTNTAWFSVTVTACNQDIGGNRLYRIESTGMAGGVSGDPRTQRQIVVQYMP